MKTTFHVEWKEFSGRRLQEPMREECFVMDSEEWYPWGITGNDPAGFKL